MNSYSPRLKPSKRQYDSASSALGSLFYELKPLLYTAVAVYAYKAGVTDHQLLKLACFGVLVFSAYIVYARLFHRGHI